MSTDKPPESNIFTRWIAPLVIIGGGVSFSSWIIANSPIVRSFEFGERPTWYLFLLPLAALVFLLVFRALVGSKSRSSDLVVIWGVAFLIAIHCLSLMSNLKKLSLEEVSPLAGGILYLGLGLSMLGLEHRSPMGIRSSATMKSPEIWNKTHRWLALALLGAGILAGAARLVAGRYAAVLIVAGPVFAFVSAIVYGARLNRRNEQPGPEDRPTS